jgi:hypothetical protein
VQCSDRHNECMNYIYLFLFCAILLSSRSDLRHDICFHVLLLLPTHTINVLRCFPFDVCLSISIIPDMSSKGLRTYPLTIGPRLDQHNSSIPVSTLQSKMQWCITLRSAHATIGCGQLTRSISSIQPCLWTTLWWV